MYTNTINIIILLGVFFGCGFGFIYSKQAVAQSVFACTDSEGTVEYTSSKRNSTCRVLKLERNNIVSSYRAPTNINYNNNRPKLNNSSNLNTGLPTPPPSPFLNNTNANTNTGSFPSINTSVQQQRDNDRKSILAKEVNTEAKKLENLQKEYNNGTPERRGDEKNYQKYLDRVDQLKKDMQRTQGNLEALRKELNIN